MCVNPIKVKNSGGIPVPCGRCTQCRARRISAWSFRLQQQEKISTNTHFLTLTYDTTKVPITTAGFMALNRRDIQLFIKRLRRSHAKIRTAEYPIRYYLVGEYGGKTNRPHYHVILFNAEQRLIQPAWGLGQIHYGSVTGASIGYTLKYMSKPSKIPIHAKDDRPKEFSLMSKGLGKNYLTENIRLWHKMAILHRMYVNIGSGKKAAMPRYYKDKLYTSEEREKIKQHFIIQSITTAAIRHEYLYNTDAVTQRKINIEHEKYKLTLAAKTDNL